MWPQHSFQTLSSNLLVKQSRWRSFWSRMMWILNADFNISRLATLHTIRADARHYVRCVWFDFGDTAETSGDLRSAACLCAAVEFKVFKKKKGGGQRDEKRCGKRDVDRSGEIKRESERQTVRRWGEREAQPPPLWGSHSISIPPVKIDGNASGTATNRVAPVMRL